MQCLLCGHSSSDLFFQSNRRFFQCAVCRLVFVPEAEHISPVAEKSRYDFHDNSLSNKDYWQYLQNCLCTFMPYIKRGDSFLDYGSGRENPFAKLLAEQGYSCKSFDLYYQKDRSLLLSTVEGVFCFESCEHFRRPLQEFSNLLSMLKPQGWLALRTEFVPSTFSSWFYHRDPTHIGFYSEDTLRWIAKSFALKIVFCSAPFVLLQKN